MVSLFNLAIVSSNRPSGVQRTEDSGHCSWTDSEHLAFKDYRWWCNPACLTRESKHIFVGFCACFVFLRSNTSPSRRLPDYYLTPMVFITWNCTAAFLVPHIPCWSFYSLTNRLPTGSTMSTRAARATSSSPPPSRTQAQPDLTIRESTHWLGTDAHLFDLVAGRVLVKSCAHAYAGYRTLTYHSLR